LYLNNNNEGPESASILPPSSVGTVFQSYATRASYNQLQQRNLPKRGSNSGNGVCWLVYLLFWELVEMIMQQNRRLLERLSSNGVSLAPREQARGNEAKGQRNGFERETVKGKIASKRAKRESRRAAKRDCRYQKKYHLPVEWWRPSQQQRNPLPSYNHQNTTKTPTSTTPASSSLLRHQRRVSPAHSTKAPSDECKWWERIPPPHDITIAATLFNHMFGGTITSLVTATSSTTPSSTSERCYSMRLRYFTNAAHQIFLSQQQTKSKGDVDKFIGSETDALAVPLFIRYRHYSIGCGISPTTFPSHHYHRL
jgi:hypothetical protein